jgi:hypothetical protein
MSNEQGFRGVPGVPDGWELVGIRKALNGEFIVNAIGNTEMWNHTLPSEYLYPIIREIEKPAKYRAFANGADFMANKGQGIAVDWSSPSDCQGFYAIVSANNIFLWVAFGGVVKSFRWEQAFEELKFRHADNSTSPFGVKIDE